MLGSIALDYAASSAAETGEPSALLARLGVLPAGHWLRVDELADAQVLREALRRCLDAAALGGVLPERDVDTINSFAADDPPRLRLTPKGDAVASAAEPVRAALAAVARDAIEILARRRFRLRRCDGCSAVFLDASRAGRRRWCSMARCGNRRKTATYRQRQR
jgi:predicted RNA-binding Zn ribbon-like protein